MLLPRLYSDDGPTSPHSYWFPLILIMVLCAGYVIYRRRTRSESGIPLHFTRPSTGVRLSEDGPPTHSFISNNASTDSLPSHALQDLPILPSFSSSHPQSQSTSARVPSPPRRSSSSPIVKDKTSGKYTGIRKSATTRSRAVEPSDSDHSEDEDDQASNARGSGTFEIGQEDDDDDHLDPLG